MREINFTIDQETGEIEIDLDGFQGKGCEQLANQLAKLLGNKIIKEKLKFEYYKPVQKQKQKLINPRW